MVKAQLTEKAFDIVFFLFNLFYRGGQMVLFHGNCLFLQKLIYRTGRGLFSGSMHVY